MTVLANIMRRGLRGAVSGFIATVPMSLAMLALQRTAPERERYRLPPEEITRRMAQRAGLADEVNEPEEVTAATMASHLGYGVASGSIYGLMPRLLPIPSIPRGILFGLSVWAVSYMGWLPAAGLFPHASRRSAGRNTVMIVAHIIWGATLASLMSKALGGWRSEIGFSDR